MSRLKISDLSFCETELPSDSQVQGGLLFSLPALLSTLSLSSSTTDSTGNQINKYIDDKGGSQYLVVKNPSGKIISVGGSVVNTSNDGGITNVHTQSFSINGINLVFT